MQAAPSVHAPGPRLPGSAPAHAAAPNRTATARPAPAPAPAKAPASGRRDPPSAAPKRAAPSRTAGRWIAAGAFVLAAGGGLGWWLAGPAPRPAIALPSAAGAAATALPQPIETAESKGASYQELLSGRADDWRVARLALNPKILVVEFPDLTSQGRTLNRLAALVEKNGAPRDRVLGDDALSRFIKQVGDTPETFYFGHDYPAETVARFFTLAVNQQVMLNDSEMRFGNLLLFSKVLREENDRLVASGDRQAVVTFSAIQKDNPATAANEGVDAQRREAILRHELSHGEFFTNAAYREHCWAFWQKLSDEERGLFRHYLTGQGYDPRNEELMVNEAQAYLMHTPDARAFSAPLFGVPQARLDAMRERFRQGMPASIFSEMPR